MSDSASTTVGKHAQKSWTRQLRILIIATQEASHGQVFTKALLPDLLWCSSQRRGSNSFRGHSLTTFEIMKMPQVITHLMEMHMPNANYLTIPSISLFPSTRRETKLPAGLPLPNLALGPAEAENTPSRTMYLSTYRTTRTSIQSLQIIHISIPTFSGSWTY